MTCLILAAGYATRLYPLTENFPKPLLPVQGQTVLDWLLSDVDAMEGMDSYVVVSNHKFYDHFISWKESSTLSHPITILDDGSTTNEERLGAVKDIVFAMDQLDLNDDLLVLAGDNLLDFSLFGFVSFFQEKQATCIMRHYEPSLERLQRTGVATVDDSERVILMEEKPKEPKSNWAVPPFYVYKKETISLIRKAIQAGCNTDAPGSFIAWLCKQTSVYAYPMPGKRWDIGNLESYEQVKREFSGPHLRKT
ncbi:MAG: nucleotidyltransferase family protein [Sphaerochaetaceae bacterium]